jgi:LysM repeat protein
MFKKIIKTGIVTMGMCGTFTAVIAFAQPQEYKDYEVKKGDTLWNISSREMSDPFSWPKIWKENPEIKNPDLIYPGQKIRLPQLYIQKEIIPMPAPLPPERAIPAPEVKPKPQVKKEEIPVKIKPAEKKYLVGKDILISSGYISDSIESRGQVIGSPPEKEVLGRTDYAYIRTLNPVRIGDRFYIVRPAGKVKHPETGAMMGYLIDVRGIASVVGKESGETKAEITTSYNDIAVGDLLFDYYEIDLPLQIAVGDVQRENFRRPDITGFIVATKERRISSAQPDIVYIDKGTKSGIVPGDIFAMTARAKFNTPNGYLQVISAKESTSTAIIRKAHKEVSVGDRFSPGTEPIAQLFPPQVLEDNVQNEVKVFIDQYTQAYELGDIDRFMSFYSTSAIENNSLRYDEIRNGYQRNFQDSRYTYSLKDLQAERSDGNVILTGTYTIKRILGDPLGGVTQGHIRWTLTRENGVLKILSVDYDRI